MTRYFFHVRKHDALEEDPEGAEFATLDEAYDEAVLAAREILAEKVLSNEIIDGQSFEITAEDGTVLQTSLSNRLCGWNSPSAPLEHPGGRLATMEPVPMILVGFGRKGDVNDRSTDDKTEGYKRRSTRYP